MNLKKTLPALALVAGLSGCGTPRVSDQDVRVWSTFGYMHKGDLASADGVERHANASLVRNKYSLEVSEGDSTTKYISRNPAGPLFRMDLDVVIQDTVKIQDPVLVSEFDAEFRDRLHDISRIKTGYSDLIRQPNEEYR